MFDTTDPLPPDAAPAKKPPRKPRPSELAKKAAKAQKPKTRPATKRKPSKPAKPKTKPAKKAKAAKKPLGKSKAPKKSANGRVLVRTERLDFRLSKAEKGKLLALAKRKKRTVTSLLQEFAAKAK